MSYRISANAPASVHKNLAQRIERTLYGLRARFVSIQFAMLVLMAALLIIPLLLADPPEQASHLDHFTRFARFMIWGFWFPLVFLSVILIGRSWCGLLCPMGAVSEWLNRRGLQKNTPRWLQNELNPLLSFVLITILGQTVGVREHPEAMAEIFGGTFLLACLIGLIYGRNKRIWCRYLCPIGALLGVFSRLGALEFQSKKRATSVDERVTEKGVCPTMIDLRCKQASRHCIACHRCTNPESPGGLAVRLRFPGDEIENIAQHQPRTNELLFLFTATGLILGGFLWLVDPRFQQIRRSLGEWFVAQGHYWVGQSGPSWLMSVHPDRREVFNWLDFFSISAYMTAWMILTALILASLTLLASVIIKKAKHLPINQSFKALGYQYVPVALVSLIIGLGGDLFLTLAYLGLSQSFTESLRLLLLIAALGWSIFLGYRILSPMRLGPVVTAIAFTPGALGSLLIGGFWLYALTGFRFLPFN